MVYDSFTITVVETLEDLGFCKKGEGRRIRQRRTHPARRRVAHQHRRRRPVLQPSGYARHLPAPGSHPATPPPVRRRPPPGSRLQDRPGPRHRRRVGFPPLRRHRHTREGLDIMTTTWNKPLPTIVGETKPFWGLLPPRPAGHPVLRRLRRIPVVSSGNLRRLLGRKRPLGTVLRPRVPSGPTP